MHNRAVLFDLDGTLLDTLDDLADSMNAVLQRLGFPAHKTACYRYFIGEGIQNLVWRTLPEANRDSATVAKGVAEMRAEYARRWADKTRPYDGIPELLDELAERRIPMAVLSNKPDGPVRDMVGRFLGLERFAVVAGAKPNVPHKPDPTAALGIAATLGIRPQGFVYLGDSNTDMLTAVAAGMFPVGALWGFRSADELLATGAKALIARPDELLGYLRPTLPKAGPST
jgi:phosphoglycolate phosphatase